MCCFSVIQSCPALLPHGLQHTRLPCPSPSPRACSNSCPLSRWCHPTISPLLSPSPPAFKSFPASGSFPMSQLFPSGGQSIGISALASILSMNIQGRFPLGLTKGLTRIFSKTTVQKHQFSGTRFLYGPTLSFIYDYWKNHVFDPSDLCQQNNVAAS